MIMAGVDVCRVNSSHGNYDQHQKVIDIIREINKEHRLNTAILVDLQGPKLRIGVMKNNEAFLEDGKEDDLFRQKSAKVLLKRFL